MVPERRLGSDQMHERLAEQEMNDPHQECLLINHNPVGLLHKGCVYSIPQHCRLESSQRDKSDCLCLLKKFKAMCQAS